MKIPNGKRAIILFSLDDCHPASSVQGYEAGGDLEQGVLGRLQRLLLRHSDLRCTLFLAASWRERALQTLLTRKIFETFSFLRDKLYFVKIWPEETFRLERHASFVKLICSLPRVEIASHGLYHIQRGLHYAQEFAKLDRKECFRRLGMIESIFKRAGLPKPLGFAPPGWGYSDVLLESLVQYGYRYVACSRDLNSPIKPNALTNGHGICGVSLTRPQRLHGLPLIHIPCNWSATSTIERAEQIIECGGVLSIKAHAIKKMGSYVSKDGLDESYCDYLDCLFTHLRVTYGDQLWCATMKEVAENYES